MLRQDSRVRRYLICSSPLAVIAAGHLTARLAEPVLGVWAWLPTVLVFWSTLALLIAWGGGGAAIGAWLRRPQGNWRWPALALTTALIPLPILLSNWQVLGSVWVWLPWLAFACINPWFEEGYWRGLLLDASREWPGWLCVPYSSLVFALSHPLIWGVNSIANRHPAVLVSTFVMGLVWAMVYRRTRSLRWAILSHGIVDLLNLAIPVFMNLYTPES